MRRLLQSTCRGAIKSIAAYLVAVVLIQILAVQLGYSQGVKEKKITGKVTASSNKEGIPGVNIVAKGTTNGAITDVNGEFTIDADAESVLVFSSIGYISQEIIVGEQTSINVSLADDVKALDEVVVVGYGEQKRSNVIGAITSVNTEDMKNKTQIRLDQALQGLAAGVNVTRNGGAPGAAASIHIRGVGSINDTEPLWIIDGIRMEPGNHFDGDDVESIEILKDASASAIYGTKAAHGVILVKTKRGKNGFQVNFKTSQGKRSPVRLPHMLNSADFVKYGTVGRLNAGTTPPDAWSNYGGVDTDWLKAYYNGGGTIQSYDLSMSKGDEKTNFYISFGHDKEKGIIIDNTYKRYSVRINSDMKMTKWLKFGESLLISRVEDNPLNDYGLGYQGGIPYRSIPIAPIYNSQNEYGGWGQAPTYFGGANPVASQYQVHEKRTYNRLDGNVYAELTPLKGLFIRTTIGYNYAGAFSQNFTEAYDYGPGYPNQHYSSLTYGAGNGNSYIGNFVFTYEKTIAKHYAKVMGGYEASQYNNKQFNLAGTNFPVGDAKSFNLVEGIITSTDLFNINQARTLSQFGRLNYNYDERFLLEGNVRRDASVPQFGPDNRWGVFPSVSAGWRVSQERFFQNVPFITNLKLRASTGVLGSDKIPAYSYLPTYSSQFAYVAFDKDGNDRGKGYFISKITNKNVGWEEVNMNNFAVDLKAFHNKFSLSFDYYIKNTRKLLYAIPNPPSAGIYVSFNSVVNPPINIGTMQNKGIDIDFGYTTTYKKFDFNITGNTSFVKNKMLSLNSNDAILGGNGGQTAGMTITKPGIPISSFYGYKVRKILSSQEEVDAINSYAKDGFYQEGATGPGDLLYRDISGEFGKPDGEITARYDRVVIGNPWPKMTYALNVNVNYNRLIDLSIQFQGVQGVDIFNANKSFTRNFSGDDNTTYDIANAWTPTHHTSNPRNIWSDPNGNFSKPSTYFIENGSYLKLRNIQIGFNVPSAFLKKISLTKMRIYANGNNVLTFTKYSGLDPEVAGSNTARGVDYGLYPQVRTFSAGLEVQF